MAKLAGTIRVERKGRVGRVLVDGAEFPYFIAWEPIEIEVNAEGPGTVRLTLLADRVEVDNDTAGAG